MWISFPVDKLINFVDLINNKAESRLLPEMHRQNLSLSYLSILKLTITYNSLFMVIQGPRRQLEFTTSLSNHKVM